MSVIGIDFGSESCYIAAAKAGGIETLANDYSLRATPSCVAFDGKKRIIGVAAKNQQVTNMKNTVSGFKRLLGRKFNDPYVQRELSNIPTMVEKLPKGEIGFKVNYLDREQYFTPEQLTAMLFTKLKETSAAALQAQVNDCVITCPIYFTNAERLALLDAAQIAGLNVLRLMNETTATALSYGFYKTDLPEDKARNVIFVDCGHSSLQVSAVAFTKGKLRMLASTWDQIGGRDFDAVLADHFTEEFYHRFKINPKSNARAYLRLVSEIEKLKKQMSANSTKLPLNIECFMNDLDVSSSMQRSEMESLCEHLFKRVEETFRKLLHESQLSLDDIHSVEIVGGSTRIPAIKHLIEQVFGKPASTTLNQDEAVSRGAALQCAIMSPAVRVREFGVTDIQNYAVKVSWDGEEDMTMGEIEVFPAFHAAPFSRLLTLKSKAPFSMLLQYAQPTFYPDPLIGRWFIRDIKPNERGEHQEIKVKVRINHHGIVLISSASLVDKRDVEELEAGVASGNGGGSQASQPSGDNKSQANGSEPMDVQQEGNEKKKRSTKLIELTMDIQSHGLTSNELQSLVQVEANMVASDAKETERVDARNALEETVYDIRNKLQGGPLERYVLEKDRDALIAMLNELENWLYEEGDDCEREVYVEKLKSVSAKTEALKNRALDYEQCPGAFDELKELINHAYQAAHEFKNGAPKYDHLTEAEFLNVTEAAERAQKWLNTNHNKFLQAPRTVDSPVTLNDIRQQIQGLRSTVTAVIYRPKPVPPKQQQQGGAGSETGKKTSEQNGDNEGGNGTETNEKSRNAGHVPEDSTMEVE